MILAAEMYGTKHLIGLVFSIISIVLILFLLKKINKPKSVLIIFSIIYYGFEFSKTTYYIISNQRLMTGQLPFNLCNLPILFLWIVVLFEHKKITMFFRPIVFSIFFGGGVAALLYPSIMLGNLESWELSKANLLPYLGFSGHSTMIIFSLYFITSGKYKPNKFDFRNVFIFITTTSLFMYFFNLRYGSDFFFLNQGKGNPLVFLQDQSHILFAVCTYLGLTTGLMIFLSLGVIISKLATPSRETNIEVELAPTET